MNAACCSVGSKVWPPQPTMLGCPQRWAYHAAQDEMIALLDTSRVRKIADLCCGTAILPTASSRRNITAQRILGLPAR